MMHIRGHPWDYDNWQYNGCPGWSYEQVLPYFKKLENQEDNTSPWAGHGGPMSVINAGRHAYNPLTPSFIEACLELGYPPTEDFNGPDMVGTAGITSTSSARPTAATPAPARRSPIWDRR